MKNLRKRHNSSIVIICILMSNKGKAVTETYDTKKAICKTLFLIVDGIAHKTAIIPNN